MKALWRRYEGSIKALPHLSQVLNKKASCRELRSEGVGWRSGVKEWGGKGLKGILPHWTNSVLQQQKENFGKLEMHCSEFHQWLIHLNKNCLYCPYSLVPYPQNLLNFHKLWDLFRSWVVSYQQRGLKLLLAGVMSWATVWRSGIRVGS